MAVDEAVEDLVLGADAVDGDEQAPSSNQSSSGAVSSLVELEPPGDRLVGVVGTAPAASCAR